MFERFSSDARNALVLARDEARELGHNWVGTEHILLGLLRAEDTVAAEVLAALDVSIHVVRAEVTRLVSVEGEYAGPVAAQVPFTPRAKKVLELSLREALSLGHNEIDTEHVLLGLARENEGLAISILDSLGADAQRIRTETLSRRPSARMRRRRKGKSKGWTLPTATRWEYRVEGLESAAPVGAEVLNELGEDGWELVSALPAELGGGLVFKRPLRLVGQRELPPDPDLDPEPEAA